jgi:predicted transcriptional regulator of viral defense system
MSQYKISSRKLFRIAETQQGYFTAQQAKVAGYEDYTHPFHVRSGNWIREFRGIYRLAKFPQTEHPDLVLWALWSQDRKGKIQGIYSHATALAIYDLSDLMPAKLYMTVPPAFRRRTPIPKPLILYKAIIKNDEIESMQGFLVTRPLRTIMDLINESTVSPDMLLQAVKEALKQGLVNRLKLKEALNQCRVNKELVSDIKRIIR